MKQLFLTSSAARVAKQIEKQIPTSIGRKLVFILTASELDTELEWRENDRKALVEAGFEVTDYTFTGKTKDQVQEDLRAFDVEDEWMKFIDVRLDKES